VTPDPPICACVHEPKTSIARSHMAAVGPAAGLIELRLDAAPPGDLDLEALLIARPRPALVTCRPPREGGAWGGSEAERLALLARAAELGAEWVDVEHDAVDALPPLPEGTGLVVSRHAFDAGAAPPVDELLASVRHPRAALGKVALAVRSSEAALAFLRRAAAEPGPVLAVPMGPAGLVGRVAGRRWGVPWLYAAANAERPSGPGQLDAFTLARLLEGRDVTPATALYGVVGRPVDHSRSPALMNAAFARLGHDGVYAWLETGDPGALLDELARDPGARGLSVTIPHKEAAARALVARGGSLAPEVEAIGALNTIVLGPGGASGHNTDALAARELLREVLRGCRRGARVDVLGSGGAARAVAWAGRSEGARVRIVARDAAKRRALAEALGVEDGGPLAGLEPGADVLVNATSVGMARAGEPDAAERSPVPPGHHRPETAAYDLVYTPERTAFLRAAGAVGARLVPGTEHFVRQARAQLALWLGAEAAATLTDADLLAAVRGPGGDAS